MPECFKDGFNKMPAKSLPAKLPRWVFIGPEGTYTPLHTDPYGTHVSLAEFDDVIVIMIRN